MFSAEREKEMNWNRPLRGWALPGLILAGALAQALRAFLEEK